MEAQNIIIVDTACTKIDCGNKWWYSQLNSLSFKEFE